MPQPTDFSRLFRDLRRDVDALLRRSPFANTGMSATAERELTVDGKLIVTGAAEIAGTLSLPAGIIDNTALAQPVVPAVGRASASAFALSTTWVELAGINLTVPAEATTLLATATGRLYAVNPNTTGGADTRGTDALFVSVKVGSSSSVATPTGISGSNGFATTTATDSYILTGLTPGSTVRLGVYGSSGYASLPSRADNYASVASTLLWIR